MAWHGSGASGGLHRRGRPGAGHDLEPSSQRDADRRKSRRDDQERRLVQHLGDQRRRPVDRPAPAGDGHVLVHRPAEGRRRRVGQFARLGKADLQRRLHRDDGEAAQGHLLERRRRVHRRRRRLHHPDPYEDQRPALERAGAGERRRRLGAGCQHRRLQAEEGQLALPCPLHGALERDVDDAQAHLREGRRPLEVRLRSAGDLGRLYPQFLRSQRQVVHLAEAARLAAHDRRPLRRTRPQIRRLHRSRPARQARDRPAQP